ncbi:sensor histidine kinase [Paenibacillus sp. BC26]|uniref:sensor histidine kinase n=1 Tax=Paenibacillus sp. BC26 TaxID=1881032 RepID=UPI0008E7FAFD|nr:histidine kinase [Paenibacillus sp. BC26]SFS55858.1 two-component system, sensor histidine kinase YesM [Paenibacillus sp. BC26]
MTFRSSKRKLDLLPYTLKHRLFAMLALSVIIPLTLIGLISFYGIYNVLQNKVEKGVEKSLEQERKGIESILSNLDYSSRQLAFEGKVGKDLKSYLTTADPLDRKELADEIEDYISLINYTNPLLGLTTYYLPDTKQFLFENLYINPKLDINDFAKINQNTTNFTIHGPHRTLYTNSRNSVFSIMRQTETSSGDKSTVPIYVYIETNVSAITSLFNNDPYGMPVRHLMLDAKDHIIYNSQEDTEFPIGADITSIKDRLGDRFVFFETSSNFGIKVAVVIDRHDYHKEMNAWLKRFAAIGILSLVIGLVIGWIIWSMIYGPLQRIRKQFKLLGENRFNEPPVSLHMKEFDELLYHFYEMRQRIRELMSEIEQKESRKRHLEVEKLMYQMNPHFIHNTLNTAQWLARINGQDEIVRLLMIFTRVLNYNLGKEGKIVTVGDEIQTVKDYMELQQIRYNHKFNVEIEVDEGTSAIEMPRFILQPLVENALYHGFKQKDGTITVRVSRADEEHLFISVKDNGEGMSQEVIEKLFHSNDPNRRKVGLGIGLNFVNNSVKMYYGDPYGLEVTSTIGVGTEMRLLLPITVKEVWDD